MNLRFYKYSNGDVFAYTGLEPKDVKGVLYHGYLCSSVGVVEKMETSLDGELLDYCPDEYRRELESSLGLKVGKPKPRPKTPKPRPKTHYTPLTTTTGSSSSSDLFVMVTSLVFTLLVFTFFGSI